MGVTWGGEAAVEADHEKGRKEGRKERTLYQESKKQEKFNCKGD
jgi:hypothetical protein